MSHVGPHVGLGEGGQVGNRGKEDRPHALHPKRNQSYPGTLTARFVGKRLDFESGRQEGLDFVGVAFEM